MIIYNIHTPRQSEVELVKAQGPQQAGEPHGMNTMRMIWALVAALAASTAASANDVPKFQPEPFWPKPLPENWILGQVSGIAVDPNDHVWLVHRPGSLVDDEKGAMQNPPATKCCKPAPAVLKFDAEGDLLASWGGPGEGYNWPKSEHGIFVDSAGNVWLAGNDKQDHMILKFSGDGKFLSQIGKPGAPGGSNSHTQLGSPAHIMLDEAANELYVADGYQNRRVIVFDSTNGNYKRHWGAYGKQPGPDDKLPPYRPDGPLSESFGNPVHCVRLANDGLVYVCDRVNDRIQVFRKDGSFVKEFFVEKATLANGSTWDLEFFPDQNETYIMNADGANNEVRTLVRDTGEVVGASGRRTK